MTVVETAVGQALVAHARAEGLDLDVLAQRLGLSSVDLGDLLSGERVVDEPLAAVLAEVVGGTRDEWMALGDRAPRVARWLSALPRFERGSLKALRDRGYVSATRKQPGRLADELDAFFDCEPDQCADLLPASFRQSTSFPVREDAVQVWLRLADMQASFVAEQENVPALEKHELRALLADLVQVGDEEPSEYLPRVRERLADVGVVVVFQPDVPGTRLSGASWPTPDGPAVVALTLRHAVDDFFWWTVYHECSHLLLEHGLVVDRPHEGGSEGQQEEDANALARSLLVPSAWEGKPPRPSEDQVVAQAAVLAVPTGVLVGQLQKRGLLDPWDMHGLKQAMPDPADLEVRPGLKSGSGQVWDASMEGLLRDATAS